MARPVQVAFNASWSSIIEHMKLAGNARLIVPQSTIDLIDSLTDIPGEMVPFPDSSEHPEWITPPQMPQWWIEEPEALAAQMDDIMGVHDVSRGQAPVNAPDSGYGLSILAEQDTTPVGKLVKGSAIAWGKVATMCLKLFEVEVVGQRKAVVQTPSQPPETYAWTGKDLARQTTATVPLEAVIPRSAAAMQAMAEKMVQMGLIQSFEQFATVAEGSGRGRHHQPPLARRGEGSLGEPHDGPRTIRACLTTSMTTTSTSRNSTTSASPASTGCLDPKIQEHVRPARQGSRGSRRRGDGEGASGHRRSTRPWPLCLQRTVAHQLMPRPSSRLAPRPGRASCRPDHLICPPRAKLPPQPWRNPVLNH
jgi:uncharacterized protein YndB with AHSA1/START domain